MRLVTRDGDTLFIERAPEGFFVEIQTINEHEDGEGTDDTIIALNADECRAVGSMLLEYADTFHRRLNE